jgi:hypothetical protein
MNTQTGNMPQFHCIYDNKFHTCQQDAKFTSLWQLKSKLTKIQLDQVTRVMVPNTSPILRQPASPLARDNEPIVPHPVQLWDQPTENDVDPILTDEPVLNLPDAEPNLNPLPVQPATPPIDEAPSLPEVVTRSGRSVHHPQRLIAAVALFLATFSPQPVDGTVLHFL